MTELPKTGEADFSAEGAPLFQAAIANFNLWTEAKVDTRNPERGPLFVTSSEKDHTVPHAIAEAAFRLRSHNPGLTEFVEMKGRAHVSVPPERRPWQEGAPVCSLQRTRRDLLDMRFLFLPRDDLPGTIAAWWAQLGGR